MRLLIAHGSDSDEIDFQGRSTVQHAVDSHCSQALRIILESGGKADPEIPKNHKRSSPLTSASFGGLAGMTKLLLDHGANISASNPEGRTYLPACTPYRHIAKIKRFRLIYILKSYF
jgi:ankyrin repeat protein